MKVVLISDTHTRHKHLTTNAYKPGLPDGDLLIHAGDFTSVGQKGEVMSFLDWAEQQAFRYTYGVVFIAGNHDRSFDPKYSKEYEDSILRNDLSHPKKPAWLLSVLSDLEPGRSRITYLENQEVTIGGFKIWGSPITPWFYGEKWAFNRQRGKDIKEVWSKIPSDTDIVITHGPVVGRHDYVPSSSQFVGCEELKNRLEEIRPKLHVCGHIHEGHGEEMVNGVTYVNASICDRFYDPVNRPIIVNL